MMKPTEIQSLDKQKQTKHYCGNMLDEAERIKRLVAFKKRLEDQAEKLDAELKEVQVMLETANSLLLEKGFRRIEIPREAVATPLEEKVVSVTESSSTRPQALPENVTQLNTSNGELLADLYWNETENSLRVVPANDKNFDINTPPFTHFLVERVLLKMQERDNELARAGHIVPDRIFCYEIKRQGNMISEINIRNIDSDRLKELKSSIRWTFEKMYEKMKDQS